MKKEKSVHDKHRERMRQRFLSGGIDSFSDHEVVEFLLFLAQPRINVNPPAHELINAFGSLANVLDADFKALKAVKGIGESSATVINFLGKLIERYNKTKQLVLPLTNPTDAKSFCKSLYSGFSQEEFFLICINDRQEVIGKFLLAQGSARFINIQISDIIKTALNCDAKRIIITHSHTSNSSTPSDEDIRFTEMLIQSCLTINIAFLDHIVVCPCSETSFVEMKILNSINKYALKELNVVPQVEDIQAVISPDYGVSNLSTIATEEKRKKYS